MDGIARYNRDRWNDLARSNIAYSRPYLNLTPDAAREVVDRCRMLGDMRDLSRFANNSFDIVWQAHSLNFIPDPAPVFDEVARVLRPGGMYRLHWNNPFTMGADESSWDGSGYRIGQRPYASGEVAWADSRWKFLDEDGTPREFNHTLSTVVNGLIRRGFVILGVQEEESDHPHAAPGTWGHFLRHVPLCLHLWARSGLAN